MNEFTNDPYIEIQPMPDLKISEKVGEGQIGFVYKAIRPSNPTDIFACKIIPEGRLKVGWERELEKISQLKGVPNIVPYHWSGTAQDHNHRMFTFVTFDFIDGINLKQYILEPPWPLDMAFIETIAKIILQVLHACRSCGIVHGDLHEGNIMISKPDQRLPDNPRTIWITDFGYGGSHNKLEPKNDYRQFFAIISSLVHKLNPSNLNPRDRVMREKISAFLEKKALEVDPTQGDFVGNPVVLLKEFIGLATIAERESAAASTGEIIQGVGDYLSAETLGYHRDEWQSLFVPEFLAAQDLLNRNITILTGARGCGKTMAFRRLTAFMDKVVEKPSGVPGSDQFIGFYLNCRDLVEAFPWLPVRLNKAMNDQIIHYFHLAWLNEICNTLALYDVEQNNNFDWLDGYLTGMFSGKYNSLPLGADVLSHVRTFIENEKERCRLSNLGKYAGLTNWPLARPDFLDNVQILLTKHVSWIGEKPLYLFLDDYTIPTITRAVQRLLNPIIFKRRSKIFFKISTEASNSFDREGLRGKTLELNQDFELIDLSTETLHQDYKSKELLLDKIFRPRINRHQIFKGKNLGLGEILGKTPLSNNDLAIQIRANAEDNKSLKRINYHGINSFVGMWSSDIRTMIQMFSDMLREANGTIKTGSILIEPTIQNNCYRTTGGEFLIFTESLNNPSLWEKSQNYRRTNEPFGKHLRDIAEAFVTISRYELTKGKYVSNQGRKYPKQAFRLEIIDKFSLPSNVIDYFDGLIRWHVFFQDWRGKSVRGMITPRLYLNRVLIPYSYLTFSSHDHIQLTNQELINLLDNPNKFIEFWHKKRKYKGNDEDELPFK